MKTNKYNIQLIKICLIQQLCKKDTKQNLINSLKEGLNFVRDFCIEDKEIIKEVVI